MRSITPEMAYIVVSFKGQEVGRWPLNGPLSIGRSTECDIVVRDILLSRKHCQIVPYRSGWIAVDAESKNGTKCEGRQIKRRGLADGDVLTLGKTEVRFQIGRLPANHKPPAKRPADPFEALSNTVSEFDPHEVEAFREKNRMPSPRPIPREPAAFEQDDLYSLLTGIASSSWDSIYAQASRPRRSIPRTNALVTAGGGSSSGGTATLVVPQRSRLGFAEELQAPAEDRPRRIARPATPMRLAAVVVEPEVEGPPAARVRKPYPLTGAVRRGTTKVRTSVDAFLQWMRKA